jgi:hypothetical protein
MRDEVRMKVGDEVAGEDEQDEFEGWGSQIAVMARQLEARHSEGESAGSIGWRLERSRL